MALAQRIEDRDEAREATVRAPAIASALRTIETEREGLACLMAAIDNGLGEPFARAVERIGAARGRVICTGMGKSGHVARREHRRLGAGAADYLAGCHTGQLKTRNTPAAPH